jgi:hypothetical protein
MTISVTTNNANYLNYNDYQALNYAVANDWWGGEDLGVSYNEQAQIVLNPATFPSGVTFSWNWPLTDAGQFDVKGYPEIIYVHQFVSGTTPLYSNEVPTPAANFASLTATYSASITGDTNDTDVAFDIWFMNPETPNPNWTTTFPETELMVWVHSPSGNPIPTNQPYTISVEGMNNAGVTVYPATPGGTGGGGQWTFAAVQSPQDALSGTISLGDIFKTLIWNGVISPNELVSDIHFGSEVAAGQGSLQINNFSVSWQANPDITVPASNTLGITSMGGNHILGNGKVDTVVYSGAYANYQIEQVGADTLITENHNISTLDDLNAVSFIKFADGTYTVANETFAPLVGQASTTHGQAPHPFYP